MRTLLIFVIVIAVLIGALVLYLHVTTSHETAAVRFPLGASDRALLASVPASADAFAYIPHAAALDARLRSNPITTGVVNSWSSRRALPRPWMIGSADLLIWQSGGQTRYLLKIDPVRAALVRTYLMLRGDAGGTILLNAPPSGEAAPADEMARIEQLAATLPQADALVVQRSSSRGAFPPIGRPSVSAVQVTTDEIQIVSHASDAGRSAPSTSLRAGSAPLTAKFPRSALLSASFQSPPRLLDDLNRLFGTKVSSLLADGGSVALYDVETGKLLPRPIGVIVVPRTETRKADLESLGRTVSRGEALGVHFRSVEHQDELVFSFDDSVDTYLKDAFDTSTVPNGRWVTRIDAPKIVPVLRGLQDNVGLRIASPRLFRAARDLGRWIESLEQAKMIEATDSSDGTTEELKVRIHAK